MPKPEFDPRKVRRRLEREGWHIVRQDGGHDIYRHAGRPGQVVVPRHRRDFSDGTARSIAKQAGWTSKSGE